jgi:hypothetical protein
VWPTPGPALIGNISSPAPPTLTPTEISDADVTSAPSPSSPPSIPDSAYPTMQLPTTENTSTLAPSPPPEFQSSLVPTQSQTITSSLIAAIPTLAAPSWAPSPAAVMVHVSQTLSGVSYSDYTGNTHSYTQTLIATYAQVLGISSTSIQDWIVTASSTRRILSSSRQFQRQRARHTLGLSSTGIVVVFTVITSKGSISFASLTQALNTATQNGQLASELKTQATIYGCNNLLRYGTAPILRLK